ncbi:hypothetical protein AVEN_161687-1 [Araneus ventricosus]|uniref:Uncharacterized protein n=1 Tax=Araneus ventricosus TaxID=182803 RepID=A0A4Y2ESG7_ARAVE|nr:hypothetical protein AVEN_161687-1 [Araneus ventricosus]
MTKTTPELASSFQTSAPHQLPRRLFDVLAQWGGLCAPHQREVVWPPTYDLACNGPGCTTGSGFEPGALQPRGRDLTTKLPHPILRFSDKDEC